MAIAICSLIATILTCFSDKKDKSLNLNNEHGARISGKGEGAGAGKGAASEGGSKANNLAKVGEMLMKLHG